MEDEVEGLGALGQTQFGRRDPLALGEHLGLELHVARLVDAVDVAERRGQQITAVLPDSQGVDGLLEVFLGGVELVVDLSLDAVLLAADHADLDLEDDLGRGGMLEKLLGDREVLADRHRRTVPHV